MDTPAPQPIRLSDYRAPDFRISHVDLTFELFDDRADVSGTLHVTRSNPDAADLVLHGGGQQVVAIAIDGEPLEPERYLQQGSDLTVSEVPDHFTLTIATRLHPDQNTELEGLYRSSGTFCTQCEAEGFRKILYFLDRPDVMATYRVTIDAPSDSCPVLLSNGNPQASEALGNGRHRAIWIDPHPKPAYLFALVAGDLVAVRDRFTTMSGRAVDLAIHVEHGDEDKCAHAMDSLKRSMRWDEEVYGREYDLDVFNIVAVHDFNMGAMENKGLNIFNAKYVLARPETATDQDFQRIEAVIAHEYFHNWTGNRITCRDWFQLSLKEGLTVFRDQQFSADMHSAAVQRISDVEELRRSQFPEDSGPTAHPVRPESYIEINNFYTMTVYEKGAELVRMMHTLLGPEAYRRGTDLYFERHDGQAVRCEDFVAAMEDAGGIDLGQFRLWYSQAGTPLVRAEGRHDPHARTYTLTLSQTLPTTPGQETKRPQHIPVAVGLVGADGTDIPLRLAGEPENINTPIPTTHVLDLKTERDSFTFTGVDEPPTPSILRGFSAPVRLELDLDDEALAFLARTDSDAFNRWDSGQVLACRVLLRQIGQHQNGEPVKIDPLLIEAMDGLLSQAESGIDVPGSVDRALIARAIRLPGEEYLAQQMIVIDVDAIHAVREAARTSIGTHLSTRLDRLYSALKDAAGTRMDGEAIGTRALANGCLGYIVAASAERGLDAARTRFEQAGTMTDRLAALSHLVDGPDNVRNPALDTFYQSWKHDPLVVDKWFSIQALSSRPDTLDAVARLMDHPDFTMRNPNRLRALIGAFAAGNQVRFHQADGAGYRLLGDVVRTLDALNPQIAARLITPLRQWRRLDEARQNHVRGVLKDIVDKPDCSRHVFEMASRTLGAS